MNAEIEQLLNTQIEKEEYSAHLYLAMASWTDHNGYEGTSKWLYIQAEEERMHMLKFVKYINERGGKSIISAIKAPPSEYKSVKHLFETVLAHEQGITNAINEIVAACNIHKDFTTQNWLQWFVNEQIEEERNARQIIDKLKLIGDGSLYMFDRDIMSLRSDNATDELSSNKTN